MAHDPVHLVQQRTEVFSPWRRLHSLELFNRLDVGVVEVRRVYDCGAFDDRYAFDDVPDLADLFDSPVNIAGVGGNVDDDIAVQLNNQAHMAPARVLRAPADTT